MKHMTRTTGLLAALAMTIAACGGGGAGDEATGDGDAAEGGSLSEYDLSGVEYTVGSKDFDEQLVLGYLSVFALEEAGATVTDEVGLAGTAAAREALTSGEIDLYWEYNGTGWGIHLGNDLDPTELPENLTEEVATRDLEENDIRWLEAAGFNNTYAFAVREEAYDELGVTNITEMTELPPEDLSICVESEFATREDGLPGLEEFIGFDFPEPIVLDTGVVYTQTDQGECNFGEVFASDGRNAALGLTIIEDDVNFFPPYNPSVTIREEKYEEAPQVGDLFAEIAGALDLETMTALNASVSADGEFPEDVARDFLVEQGFISG